MKVFISILWFSGYNTLLLHRLYWAMEPDVRNKLIKSSIPRNHFDEMMKYFHAADSKNLDEEDKFVKVCTFLKKINEPFLKYGEVFGPTSVSIDESIIPEYRDHSLNSSSVADLFAGVIMNG